MIMKNRLLRFVPTVRSEMSWSLVGFSLVFLRLQQKESKEKVWRQVCRCGKGYLCQQNCPVFEAWMSGPKRPRSFEKSFVHLSRKSLEGAGKVFGFTIRVSLRLSRGGTTCSSSGRRLTLATPHIWDSKETFSFTWLRAKLTRAVLASFTLSVAALVTLISALLFFLTKLLRLKTSFLAYSRRLVRMLRKTSS